MKEYKIGEKFVWEGKELVCVEEKQIMSCVSCCFRDGEYEDCGLCREDQREDGQNVIFAEVIKEHDVREKEEIKIIRKFEDLVGLTNGQGLKLVWTKDGQEKLHVSDNGNRLTFWWRHEIDAECLETLKAMGFKFEFRVKPIEEEVLAKYETVKFVLGCRNCVIFKNSVGEYERVDTLINYLGTKYYTKEDAEAICRELNS